VVQARASGPAPFGPGSIDRAYGQPQPDTPASASTVSPAAIDTPARAHGLPAPNSAKPLSGVAVALARSQAVVTLKSPLPASSTLQ